MRISKLKQRLTAMAAAAALAVTALAPAPAWAAGNVAKIGDVEYPTLEEAIAAAQNGATIELLDNVSSSTGTKIENKSLTLDLGGHELSAEHGSAALIITNTTPQTVAIKNGSMYNTRANVLSVTAESQLILRVDSVSFLNPTQDNTEPCVFLSGPISAQMNDETQITAAQCIATKGSDRGVCSLMLNNAIITQNGSGSGFDYTALKIQKGSNVTANGCMIQSNNTVFYSPNASSEPAGIPAATLVVNGGTYRAKGNVIQLFTGAACKVKLNSGGFTGTFDKRESSESSIVINGGTYSDKAGAKQLLAPGLDLDAGGNVVEAQPTSGFCGGDISDEKQEYVTGAYTRTVYGNLAWSVAANSDGADTYTLSITGNGPMAAFDYMDEAHPSYAPWTWYGWANKITQVSINEGVTSLGAHSLRGLSNVSEITLPSSLAQAPSSAFLDCSSLASIKLAGENAALSTDAAGNLYNKAQTTLIKIPEGTAQETYVAPATLERVEYVAASRTGIKTFDFSQAKVSEFGQEALALSDECTSITLSNVETLKVGHYGLADKPFIKVPAATKNLTLSTYALNADASAGVDISHVENLTLEKPTWIGDNFGNGAFAFGGAKYVYVASDEVAEQVVKTFTGQPETSIAEPVIAVVGEGAIDFDPASAEIATPVSGDKDKIFAGWKDASGNVVTEFTAGQVYTAQYAYPVAEVNGTGYLTLQDAIDAAKDGDTVKLLSPAAVSEDLRVAASITFDLNEQELNVGSGILAICDGATVTLTGNGVLKGDGSTGNPEGYVALVDPDSGLVVDGIVVKGKYGIYSNGRLELLRAQIDTEGWSVAANASAQVTIGSKGATEEQNAKNVVMNSKGNCLGTNAAHSNPDMTVTIFGGSFNALVGNKWNEGPVYWASHGTLSIHGGTFKGIGETAAIFQKNGTVNISGGTFSAKDGFKIDATPGDTTEVYANITGGSFSGTRSGFYVNAGTDAGIGFKDSYAVTISGEPVFKGGSEKALYTKTTAADAAGVPVMQISGGTFDEVPEERFFADGYGLLEPDADGNYVVHQHEWLEEFETNKDEHWHKCAKCDAKHEVEQHEGELVNAKPATCGEDGYAGDTVCSICEYVLAKGEVVPATGKHDWSDWSVTKNPACAEEGEESRTCATCKKVETKIIPATGEHEFSDKWTAGPDSHWHACAGCGAKSGEADHEGGEWVANKADHWRTCEACGGAYAIGAHEFGDWKVTREPTATEPGERERVCEACGEPASEEIPALGEKPAGKPGKPDSKPGKDEGDKLAQTGDDSMLPIAIAGGVGVAAVAAGVVVAIKRRK